MTFLWQDEDFLALREELSLFAHERSAELARSAERAEFPRDIFAEMGERGWVGSIAPVSAGGNGGGTLRYAIIEELCGRTGLPAPQVSAQGQRWLLEWGSLEQRKRYLPAIARGEMVFCEAISEPGAGSSLKDIRAFARRSGDRWYLNGSKTHVNLGAEADVCLVYAKTEEGLTAFLVDTNAPGVMRRKTDPIGLRLLPTADMEFTDVEVTADDVLGEVGVGLRTFLSVFNMSRVGNAAALVGYGCRALAAAIDFARQREVAGSVVSDFQGIQWLVAQAHTKLTAAVHAYQDAAAAESDAVKTCAAKLLAIDAADFAVNESFALVGAHGLYHGTPWYQLLGEVKVLRTAGGSREVLRNYLAKRILDSADYQGIGG